MKIDCSKFGRKNSFSFKFRYGDSAVYINSNSITHEVWEATLASYRNQWQREYLNTPNTSASWTTTSTDYSYTHWLNSDEYRTALYGNFTTV